MSDNNNNNGDHSDDDAPSTTEVETDDVNAGGNGHGDSGTPYADDDTEVITPWK